MFSQLKYENKLLTINSKELELQIKIYWEQLSVVINLNENSVSESIKMFVCIKYFALIY